MTCWAFQKLNRKEQKVATQLLGKLHQHDDFFRTYKFLHKVLTGMGASNLIRVDNYVDIDCRRGDANESLFGKNLFLNCRSTSARLVDNCSLSRKT